MIGFLAPPPLKWCRIYSINSMTYPPNEPHNTFLREDIVKANLSPPSANRAWQSSACVMGMQLPHSPGGAYYRSPRTPWTPGLPARDPPARPPPPDF